MTGVTPMKYARFLAVILAGTAIGQGLQTDDRIRLLEEKARADRANSELQVALAEALLQKLRETGDAGYLTRASKVVEPVIAADHKNVLALRVQNAIEMNLHHFPQVAASAE